MSTLVKMPNCWKSRVTAHMSLSLIILRNISKLTVYRKNFNINIMYERVFLVIIIDIINIMFIFALYFSQYNGIMYTYELSENSK